MRSGVTSRGLFSPRRVLVAVVAALGVAALSTVAAVIWTGGDEEADETPAVQLGGAAIPGSGEEFDGCQLVHRLEAQEILAGRVLQARKPVEGAAAATCVWELPEETHPKMLQLSVYRGDEFFRPEGFEDDPTFERIEGVGEEAFFVQALGVQLHFRAADYSVLVSVEGFEGQAPLDRETVKRQLTGLAQRMVEQL